MRYYIGNSSREFMKLHEDKNTFRGILARNMLFSDILGSLGCSIMGLGVFLMGGRAC